MVWTVHSKGAPNSRHYEICVITEDNTHGRKSYGWAGPQKKMVSTSGGPCHETVDEWLWEQLMGVAQKLADKLNSEEPERAVEKYSST